jgi:hypothetical protein
VTPEPISLSVFDELLKGTKFALLLRRHTP